MPTEIKMPQLGESVHEGTISRWLKKPGERVEKYEALLEVASDKVESEVSSPEAGVVQSILVPEGQTVPVGTVLAVLDRGGGAGTTASPAGEVTAGQESRAEAAATAGLQTAAISAPAAEAGRAARVSPLAARIAQDEGIDLETVQGSGPGGQVTKEDVLRAKTQRTTVEPGSRGAGEPGAAVGFASSRDVGGFLSPRVQMLARQLAVDLSQVHGTGKDGRITARDVEEFAARARQAPAAAPTVTAPLAPPSPPTPAPPPPLPIAAGASGGEAPALAPGDELVPLTQMRRLIAEHMVRSKQTAPHVTTVHEADVTRMVQFFNAHKDAFRQREGFNLTYTPFFVQAVVNALKAFPNVNVSFTEQGIVRRRAINIGLAVALEDGGLLVPVIKAADEKTLVRLARDVTDLATRARARKLSPDDTRGSTFSLTNYGVFGSLLGTPVINQPEAAILGVGAVKKRPVVVESELGDTIAVRSMVYLALSFDHRAFDGSLADQFMQRVVKELESGQWSL